MYPNPIKQKLADGQVVFGTGLAAFSPHIAGPTLDTGIDFLWIDTEHMPYGAEALDTIPVLARQRGVAPMIRVANNDPALIKKAYDVGAVLVMVPQVNTAEEAAAAVDAAHYAPIGNRGVSPMWTRIAGQDWNETIETANDETLLICQMESQQSWDNLDAIAAVEGVDALLIGTNDLSAEMGIPDQLTHDRITDAYRRMIAACRKHGKFPGMGGIYDQVLTEKFISMGVRFVQGGGDTSLMMSAGRSRMEFLNSIPL